MATVTGSIAAQLGALTAQFVGETPTPLYGYLGEFTAAFTGVANSNTGTIAADLGDFTSNILATVGVTEGVIAAQLGDFTANLDGTSAPPYTIYAYAERVVLSFPEAFDLYSDAETLSNWTISALTPGDPAITISNAYIDGNDLVFETNEHVNGSSYELNAPLGFTVPAYGWDSGAPLSIPYTGVGVSPFLILARAIDSRTLDAYFSEPVEPTDAADPLNYTISGGVTVTAAAVTSSVSVRLTTSEQARSTVYTLTASNIHDLSGNET